MLALQEYNKIAVKLASGDLPPDEPLFTLRARDKFAATVIRFWIDLVEVNIKNPSSKSRGKLVEAEHLAKLMDEWSVKQTPGCPETRSESTPVEKLFRARLKIERETVVRELMAAKVEEWMNDGEDEVVRCLTNMVVDGVKWDDDYITEIAEGLLWDNDPEFHV